MKMFFCVTIMFIIITANILNAQTFEVSGNDSLTQVSIGDTIRLSTEEEDITIQIESETRMLIKAGSLLTLDGDPQTLDIILEDGQLFVDRKGLREINTLRIFAQGYIFIPPQDAAFGVKATPQGAPTLAVLRGEAKMQSVNGNSVDVGIGGFATVNSNGVIVSGELSSRGVAQLETWSGVKIKSEQEETNEETTGTVYIEVDDEEDDSRPLTKRELRRMRKEERRLAKEARREERRNR